MDGCYIVDEKHKSMKDGTEAEMSLTYGQGMWATGVLDHSENSQDQWNYLASLPFFEDRNSSIALPLRVLDRHNHNEAVQLIRFTRTGGYDCSGGAVQQAQLKIEGDFVRIADQQVLFKKQLGALLAELLHMDPGRVSVQKLRAGSIIADVLVYPPATALGDAREEQPRVGAGDGLWNLWTALQATS